MANITLNATMRPSLSATIIFQQATEPKAVYYPRYWQGPRHKLFRRRIWIYWWRVEPGTPTYGGQMVWVFMLGFDTPRSL